MKRRMFGGGEKFGGGGDLERRKTTKTTKGGRDLQELFAANDSDAGIAPAWEMQIPESLSLQELSGHNSCWRSIRARCSPASTFWLSSANIIKCRKARR